MSSSGMVTFQRHRAPHTVHLLSWMLALDKDGFTSCHLLTCHFMASSIEEIIDHFKGFKCAVRFPHACELCQRGTDNEISLLYHNIYVHGISPTEKEKSSVFEYLSAKKKVTPYIQKAWTLYLKRKGYLKCLKRSCNLVLSSPQEMEAHYLNGCWEGTLSPASLRDRPTCPTCSGEFTSAAELERHITRHHLQELRLTAFVKETSSIGLDERRDQWTHDIISTKQTFCPVPGCKFVNNRLAVMENHFKTCTGKFHPSFKVCCHCSAWLPNSVELESHMQLFHKDLPVFTVPEDNFPTRSDEGNGVRKMYQPKKHIRQQEIQNSLKSQESGCNFQNSDLSSVAELNKNVDLKDSSIPDPVAACQSSTTPKIKLKPKYKNIDFNENQKDLSKIQFSTDLLPDDNQQNSTFDEVPFVTINVNDPEVKTVKKPSRLFKKQVQPSVTNVNLARDKLLLPSTLEDVAKNLAAETDIPVDLTYVGNDGNINIRMSNMPKVNVQKTFPTDIDSVLKALRKDSFSILDKVAQKTVIRNDVKKFLIPSSKRLFSFDLSVKKNSSSNISSEFIIDDEQDCALEQQKSDRMNMRDENKILMDFNELETDLIKVENSGDIGKEQNDTTIRVLSPIFCESSQNIEQSETPIICQSEDATTAQSVSNNVLEPPQNLNSPTNSCETTRANYVPNDPLRTPKSGIKEKFSLTLTSINEFEKTAPEILSAESKSMNSYDFDEEITKFYDDEKMSNDGSFNNDDCNCDELSDDEMESQENIKKIVGETNVSTIKPGQISPTIRQIVHQKSKSISPVCNEIVKQDTNSVDALDNNNDLKLSTNEQNFHTANNCYSNDVNKNGITLEEKPGFEFDNLPPDAPQDMNTAQNNNCIVLNNHLPKSILSIKHNNSDLRTTVSEECCNNLKSDASTYNSINLKTKLTPQRGGPKTRGGTRIRRGQEIRGISNTRGGTDIRRIPETCESDNPKEIPDAGLNLSEDTKPGIIFMGSEMYTVSVRDGVRILDPVHIPDSCKTVSSPVSGSGAESCYGFSTKKAPDVFRFLWKELKPPQEIVVLNLSVDVPIPSSGVGSQSQDPNPTAPTPAEDHGTDGPPAPEGLNPNAPTATEDNNPNDPIIAEDNNPNDPIIAEDNNPNDPIIAEDNNPNDPIIAEDHHSDISSIAEVHRNPDDSAAAEDHCPEVSTAAEVLFPDDSTAAEDHNMDPPTNVEDQRSGDSSFAEELHAEAPSTAEDRHSENPSPAEDRHSDVSSDAEESQSDANNDEIPSNVHISIKISPFGISVNSKGKLTNMSTVEKYVTPDSLSPVLTNPGRKRRDFVEIHDVEEELPTLENEFKEVSKSSEYGRGKRKSRTSVDESNLGIVASNQSQYPDEPPTKKGRRPKKSLKLDSEPFKMLGKCDPIENDVLSKNEPSENALTPSYSWKKHGKWKKNVTNQNPIESPLPTKQDDSMLTPVQCESLKNVQDGMDKSENVPTPAQSEKFGVDMSSSALENANSSGPLSLGSSDSVLQSESLNVVIKDTNDNSGNLSRPLQAKKKRGRPRKKITNSNLIVTQSSSDLENAEKSESIVKDNNDDLSENVETSIQSGSQKKYVTNQSPISTAPCALDNANSSAPVSPVSSHSILQSESIRGAIIDRNDDSGNVSMPFQTRKKPGRPRKKIANSNLIVTPSSFTSALANVNPMLTSKKSTGINSVLECENSLSVDELTPTHSGREQNPIGTPAISNLENADSILKFKKSESIVEGNTEDLSENNDSFIQSGSQKNDVTDQNLISATSALENSNSSAPLSLVRSHSMLQSESISGAIEDINVDSGNISRPSQTKRKPGRPKKKFSNSNLIVTPSSSTSALENMNPMFTSKKSGGITPVVECENRASLDELTPTRGRGQNTIENPSTFILENADPMLKSESIVEDNTEYLPENNDSFIQSVSQKNDVTDQNLISATSSASENANNSVPLSLGSSDSILRSESISIVIKDNSDNSGNVARKRPGRPRKKIAHSNIIVTPSSSTSALENMNPMLTSKKSTGITPVVECENRLSLDELTPTRGRGQNPIENPSTFILENADSFLKSESIVKDNAEELSENNDSSIQSVSQKNDVTDQNLISASSSALENSNSSAPLSLVSSHSMLLSESISGAIEGINDDSGNISRPSQTKRKPGRPRKKITNSNLIVTPSSSTSALENMNPMFTSKKSGGITPVVECENRLSLDELTPTRGRGQNTIENPSTFILEKADSMLKSESIVKDNTEYLSENSDSFIQSGSQKNDVTDLNLISATPSASENANNSVPLSLGSSDSILRSESISIVIKDNKDNSGNVPRKRPGRPRKKIAHSNLIVTPSCGMNSVVESEKSVSVNELTDSILKFEKSESIVNIKDNNDDLSEDNEGAIPSGSQKEVVTKHNLISTPSLENADSMSNSVPINVVEGVNDKAENVSTPMKTGKKRGRPRKSVCNQNFNDTPSPLTGPDVFSKSSDYRRGKRKSRISVNNISFADLNEFGFDNVDDVTFDTIQNCDEPRQKKVRAVKSQKYSDSEEFITEVQSENTKPSNFVENESDVSNTFLTPVGSGRKRGKLKETILSSTPITAQLSSPSDTNSQLISEEVNLIKTDNQMSITNVLTPVVSGHKKRGRPRKKLLTNSITIDTSSTSVVENSILTSDADMSSCLDETTEDCYSDKEHNDMSRDSDYEMSDDLETSENKTYRWGRPSREISIFDNTPGESKQVTCAKCKDTMTRKSFRKFHIKKHNFITWAEEDGPLDLTNDTLLCRVLNRGKRLYPGFIFRCELCRYFCRAPVSFARHYRKCDGSTPFVAKNKICRLKTPNFDIVEEEVPLTDPSEGTSAGTDRVSTKQTRKYEKCNILNDRIDCLVKLTMPNAMVKCAVCGESMTAKTYQKSHMVKHSFLCWLEGEKPLEVSELLSECPHCGRMMRPLSLAAHIYQTHRNASVSGTSPVAPSYGDAEGGGGMEDETAEATDLKRRSTATKCLNQMSHFLDDESDDKEGADEDFKPFKSLSERECYVVKGRRPRKLVKTLWMKSLSQGKAVVCPLRSSTKGERCTFKARDLGTMIEHYKYCSFNPQEYKCKGCDYSNTDEQEVMTHAVSCVGDEDYDSSLEESQERLAIPFLRHLEKRSNIRRHIFVPALHLAKEADELATSESPLFPDFQVTESDCQPLPAESEEGRSYRPVGCLSLPLRSGGASSRQAAAFSQLPTFQARLLNDGEEAIGYTGGTVTSLAWTPAWDNSLEQYLACSSGHQGSGQEELQAGSTYRGPGLIQIWSTGPLSNCAVERGPVRLEYVYGLCHDEHTVWSLAWCPGRERPDTSRLGLLAAATASGLIPIYALPKPAHLPLSTSRYYKVKPVLLLETPASEKCQCSAIAWSNVKPYRIIAGGFVNGVIGIWDLTTAGSPLLGTSRGTLRPIKIFNAHHSSITGLCLSEENEDFLASSSFDRSVKCWELRDTSSPLSTSYKGVTTGLDWLSTWLSFASSYDYGYANNGKTNVLNSLRGFAQSRSIHYDVKASSLDVSANNWLNAVAASFENGQVIVTFLLKHMGHRREIPKYNKVIMQCKMVDLKKMTPNSTDSGKTDGEGTLSPSEKYGLEIKTDLKVRNFGANDSLTIDTSPGRVDLHQLAAVNKVAWNTSRSGFTYLVAGLESGFLLLTRLSFPVPEQKLIQSIRQQTP